MNYFSINDVIWMLVLVALFGVAGLYFYFQSTVGYDPWWFLRPLNYLGELLFPDNDAPLVWSSQLVKADIALAGGAKVGGYDYAMLAGRDGRVILQVQLKRYVMVHIVAVGAKSGWKSGLKKLRLRRGFVPVSLEGNFPDDFAMYCSAGQERELVQLFDPADMAYFADFCRAYDFELINNTLYIAQAVHARDASDSTTMPEDAENFLKRNENLLARL